jgi:hypothetical protein
MKKRSHLWKPYFRNEIQKLAPVPKKATLPQDSDILRKPQ